MLRRLTDTDSATVESIGGKAMGLVRMLRAQLRVPEAWVIPAGVSLDESARAECLTELDTWWAATSAEFPESRWAVRSSAVAEDLEGASFAGVYDTVLGIADLPALRDAVEKCWAAHIADRADTYRAARDMDASGGIALVIQRMLQPTAAGVMLTTNPRRAFADEIVVDAAWGLGEAVVSGKVDPDHYVIDRSTGAVREQRIATKNIETICDGTLLDRAVPTNRQDLPVLDGTALSQLHRLAATVTDRVGPSRDIEWALCDNQIWVLQDRPITTVPSRSPSNVWSRLWGDEYKSEYTRPLSNLMMDTWMTAPMFIETLRLSKRYDLATRAPFKLYQGYLYFDGSYATSMAEMFPKSMRESIFGAWFSPLWLTRIQDAPFRPRHLLNTLLATRRDRARGGISSNLAAMQAHCAHIESDILPLLAQDYTALTETRWREQFDQLTDFGLEHFRILRWGMGTYNTVLHGLLGDLLTKWASDTDGQIYCALISGLPGTHTAEINAEIYDLACAARTDPDFARRLRDTEDWRSLRAQTADQSFWRELDEFLGRHGHRAANRDIATPRWSERPEMIIGLVHAQLVGNGGDPRADEARSARSRLDATDAAIRRVRRGPSGRLRARLLASVCERAQTYTVYRENQRYYLDYLITHQRRLVLEQARRLVNAEKLTDPDDVFLLTADEFYAAISTFRTDVEAVSDDELARRRQHFHTFRNRMPATFLFDDVETEGELVEGDSTTEQSSDGFTGVAASRGVATGRTFCVGEIDELANVHPGDILVVTTIDPAWTSVFGMLGGLITETGGVLSHGAILAREYGLPTVTGVADAMRLLPSGTAVVVDGTRGTVRIDAPHSPPAADDVAVSPSAGR